MKAAEHVHLIKKEFYSIRSLDRLRSLSGIRCGCPAWDHVYTDKEWKDVLAERREMLFKKKEAAAE